MITLNDNFQNNSGKALDNKLSKVITGKSVAFSSVTEANTAIPTAYRNTIDLVWVNLAGINTPHQYQGGTADSNLLPFLKTVNGGSLIGNGNIVVTGGGTIDAIPTDGSNNTVSSNGVFDALATKQATLISGTTIKTVGGVSLMGSGDIPISGGGSSKTTQQHTTGATVTIGATSDWLIINPATLLSSLTVTLKSSPSDRDEIEISFGGTITSGNVVTTLSITGGTIVGNSSFSNIQIGDVLKYRYNNSNTKWYQIK